jgi:protein-S-isoprenylcysteine O-methyltransferase Ste14
LITNSAFARVRHPLYAGSLMFYLSLVMATLSLVSLAVWGAMFAFYDVIASYEERRLAEAFGPAYQAYRAKVPKWLPRFGAAR